MTRTVGALRRVSVGVTLVALMSMMLALARASSRDGWGLLYCNTTRAPTGCCFEDGDCFKCTDVIVGHIGVSGVLAGDWTLVKGSAKGLTWGNPVVPALSNGHPGAIITANWASPESSLQFETPARLNARSTLGVQVNADVSGPYADGNFSLSLGNRTAGHVWVLRFVTAKQAAYCITTSPTHEEKVVGVIDITMAGAIDWTSTTYTMRVLQDDETVNMTVMAGNGNTTVGTCSGSLADVVLKNDATVLAIEATAAPYSELAVAVSDVRLSDSLLPPRAPSTRVENAVPLVVGNGVTVAQVKGSDKLLLVRDTQAIGVISIVAELARPVYSNGTSSVRVARAPLQLLSTAATGSNQFAQRWGFTQERGLCVDITWAVRFTAPRSPASNVSSLVDATIAVRRTGNGTVSTDVLARVTVAVEPTNAPGMEPLTGTSFPFLMNGYSLDPDARFDGVNGSTVFAAWGTTQMILFPGEATPGWVVDPTTGVRIRAFTLPATSVPVVSMRGTGGGIFAMADPRSSFLLQANRRQLLLSRCFFLRHNTTEDSGYFNGDVMTEYRLSLALTSPRCDWADQLAVYVEQNAWMSEGPKMDPPGTMTLFAKNNNEKKLPAKSDVQRIKDQRSVISAAAFNEFWPTSSQEPLLSSGAGLDFAKSHGVNVFLWSNVRMSPNVTMCPYEDPALDYRHFEDDSAQRNGSGALEALWDGFAMNPSTDFSFGRFQLERIVSTVKSYNLSGLFFDFYGDTMDSDVCRTYEQFPFYPLQVAEAEFIKKVAVTLHNESRLLVINCPHASMQVRHLADAVSCDSNGAVGDITFSDSIAHRTSGHPSLLLRNTLPSLTSGAVLDLMLPGVFYGAVPNMWQSMHDPNDQPTADLLVAAALPLAFRLADMMPAGGSLSTGQLWWVAGHRTSATSAAITLRVPSESATVGRFNVSLAPHAALAPSAGPLSVLLWDGVGAYTQLATGNSVELTTKRVRVLIGPGSTRALLYLPAAEAAAVVESYGYV